MVESYLQFIVVNENPSSEFLVKLTALSMFAHPPAAKEKSGLSWKRGAFKLGEEEERKLEQPCPLRFRSTEDYERLKH